MTSSTATETEYHVAITADGETIERAVFSDVEKAMRYMLNAGQGEGYQVSMTTHEVPVDTFDWEQLKREEQAS